MTPQSQKFCELLDDWYLLWKGKKSDDGSPHFLGVAKEQLKDVICDWMDKEFNENAQRDTHYNNPCSCSCSCSCHDLKSLFPESAVRKHGCCPEQYGCG